MTSFSVDPTATGAAAGTGASSRRTQATVITRAEPSYDEQLRSRRKRYMIMMSLRVPFLILATALYQTPWLAMLVIAISIPLPWAAVLIANDRPARKATTVIPGTINYERALPPGGREVVDSTPDDVAGAATPPAGSYRSG
jgi:hypothetical protein